MTQCSPASYQNTFASRLPRSMLRMTGLPSYGRQVRPRSVL